MDADNDSWDVNLPCLEPHERFCFSCGPAQPCFNRCCAQLNLPLTPYDVLQLSAGTGLSAQEFLKTYTLASHDDPTGIPFFYLRMIESPDAPCPFVTPAGCSVYDNRPGACRAYPLGRGARLDQNGISERFFLVREEHCLGFGGGPGRTPAEWFANQGLELHNYFNDRFMRLQTLIRATGRPLEGKLQGMAILSLWHMDEFDNFIKRVNLPKRVQGSLMDSYTAAAPEQAQEALLDLGFGWLELAIFGRAEGLAPRQAFY